MITKEQRAEWRSGLRALTNGAPWAVDFSGNAVAEKAMLPIIANATELLDALDAADKKYAAIERRIFTAEVYRDVALSECSDIDRVNEIARLRDQVATLTTRMESMLAAFAVGFSAHAAGAPQATAESGHPSCCPHPIGSEEQMLWSYGWSKAASEELAERMEKERDMLASSRIQAAEVRDGDVVVVRLHGYWQAQPEARARAGATVRAQLDAAGATAVGVLLLDANDPPPSVLRRADESQRDGRAKGFVNVLSRACREMGMDDTEWYDEAMALIRREGEGTDPTPRRRPMSQVIGLRVGAIERLIQAERDGAFVDATIEDLAPDVRFRSLRTRVDAITAPVPLEGGRIFVALSAAQTYGNNVGVLACEG